MHQKEYEKLYNFEGFYWWHVGRRYILDAFLKRFLKNRNNKILEIGCGTGGNLEVLGKFGEITGLDNSEEALSFCKKRGFDNLILGRAEKIDFPSEQIDLVVALDVLEHIKEDEKAMGEAWRVLKRGGYFILTVPAYQFLWSEHDEVLSHQRRYSISELSQKIEKSGFNIIKISYVISFVFPLVLGYRIFRKIFWPKSRQNTAYLMLPKFINNFFIYLLKLESFLLKYFNFPFGVSIIVIAAKAIR